MNLSHDSLELEYAFWIIIDPNKPFPSTPLRPFQCCKLYFVRSWANSDLKSQIHLLSFCGRNK